MSDHVELRQHAGVLEIRLNRPDKKNALTGDMYEALIDAFDEADRSEEIAAMLLCGEGGVFTAGNDIGDFMRHAGKSDDFPALRFIRRLAVIDTPLVAAVDGAAIGIGTTLLFHCDLVYASHNAQFKMPFVDLALVPEAASSLLARQWVGAARANEMLLLGESMDSEAALACGLVNALVDTAQLHALALEKAQALAAKPRQALQTTRRLMRGDPAAILARIDEEAIAFKEAMGSREAAEVFMAFMARSKK